MSADDSAVSVWVITTDEDLVVARHTHDVLHPIRVAGNKHGGSTGILQSPDSQAGEMAVLSA